MGGGYGMHLTIMPPKRTIKEVEAAMEAYFNKNSSASWISEFSLGGASRMP
jgi:hypothetical protein